LAKDAEKNPPKEDKRIRIKGQRQKRSGQEETKIKKTKIR
jgi:hypothetical protein